MMEIAFWYLVGWVVTALVFVALETRRPASCWLSTYPDGKAYKSGLVWLAAFAVFGLVWPFSWATAIPEMIVDQFRQEQRRD